MVEERQNQILDKKKRSAGIFATTLQELRIEDCAGSNEIEILIQVDNGK